MVKSNSACNWSARAARSPARPTKYSRFSFCLLRTSVNLSTLSVQSFTCYSRRPRFREVSSFSCCSAAGVNSTDPLNVSSRCVCTISALRFSISSFFSRITASRVCASTTDAAASPSSLSCYNYCLSSRTYYFSCWMVELSLGVYISLTWAFTMIFFALSANRRLFSVS